MVDLLGGREGVRGGGERRGKKRRRGVGGKREIEMWMKGNEERRGGGLRSTVEGRGRGGRF